MINYYADTDDILKSDCKVLVNPVNCVGVMGKGLALQFKKKYPDMFEQYQSDCRNKLIKIGEINVYTVLGKTIFNFPTKIHWKNKSKIEYIQSGIDDLIHQLMIRNLNSIAIPPLGCGLGGLEWEQVDQVITEAFIPYPEIEVDLYMPSSVMDKWVQEYEYYIDRQYNSVHELQIKWNQ